ncbi:MAG: hypothetical protein ISS70_26685 [Phycisphaerae bacterium]|nr:hypothetical protein [Phycisphaerae bacterium]
MDRLEKSGRLKRSAALSQADWSLPERSRMGGGRLFPTIPKACGFEAATQS